MTNEYVPDAFPSFGFRRGRGGGVSGFVFWTICFEAGEGADGAAVQLDGHGAADAGHHCFKQARTVCELFRVVSVERDVFRSSAVVEHH